MYKKGKRVQNRKALGGPSAETTQGKRFYVDAVQERSKKEKPWKGGGKAWEETGQC
jgi:hypothetical protein